MFKHLLVIPDGFFYQPMTVWFQRAKKISYTRKKLRCHVVFSLVNRVRVPIPFTQYRPLFNMPMMFAWNMGKYKNTTI